MISWFRLTTPTQTDFVARRVGARGEHHFEGDPSEIIRWAEFLETDQPYVWRQPSRLMRVLLIPASLISLGLIRHLFDEAPRRWPFPPGGP